MIKIQANLDTNPLKTDILLKPGCKGGKPCEYMSGYTVNAHMNEVFGFNGWNTEVRSWVPWKRGQGFILTLRCHSFSKKIKTFLRHQAMIRVIIMLASPSTAK